ncbi:MAG: peptidoglycan DD-metalloendopeptidase family protein [Firmicutes bacterium]|nr:peptidoglycan DD-metalloendopeptidase family protein [Bacillota bacterium]
MLPYLDQSKLRITNPYGKIDASYTAGYHTGLDFVSDGEKLITAIASGKVIRSQLYGAWGNFIVVQQEDGLYCVYAHLSRRDVACGDYVAQGQVIGQEGSTGNSTGSHLHIELEQTYYDPYSTINIADYLGIKNEVGAVEYLPSEWAKDAQAWAINQGVSDGKSPKEEVTREQVWTMLYRLR